MDILKKKFSIKKEIYDTYKILQFKHFPINCIGTASYLYLYYFSDYDLISDIKGHYSTYNIHQEFKRIIDQIDYFIEFKIQRLDGTKHKYFNKAGFKIDSFEKEFHDVEYCKIDLIIYKDYFFTEVSCNYYFNEKPINIEKSLVSNVHEQIKDKQYFKALKRIFSLLIDIRRSTLSADAPQKSTRFSGDQKTNKKALVSSQLEILTKLFNSEYGEKYVIVNNLKLIKLLEGKFKDKQTKLNIAHNLQVLNIENKNIDTIIKQFTKEYNNIGKIILYKYYPNI